MKQLNISINSTAVNPFSVFISDKIKINDKVYEGQYEYKFIYEHIYEIAKYFIDNLPKYKISFWFDGEPITEMKMEESWHNWINEEELGI